MSRAPQETCENEDCTCCSCYVIRAFQRLYVHVPVRRLDINFGDLNLPTSTGVSYNVPMPKQVRRVSSSHFFTCARSFRARTPAKTCEHFIGPSLSRVSVAYISPFEPRLALKIVHPSPHATKESTVHGHRKRGFRSAYFSLAISHSPQMLPCRSADSCTRTEIPRLKARQLLQTLFQSSEDTSRPTISISCTIFATTWRNI